MKIINNIKVEIPETNTHYFHLEEYSKDSDNVLIYGYDTLQNPPNLSMYNTKIYFNVTMPTEFCSSQNIYIDDWFDKVYTICPYSVDWLNKLKNTNKYRCVWYPIHEKYTPSNTTKPYDICYHGGIHSDKYIEMLQIISQFKYKFMTMTRYINVKTRSALSYATDTNLSYIEKMNLISKCKISICYNNYPQPSLKKHPMHENNIAFKHVDDLHLMPQLKCRFIEACFSKTLNLVEKDKWNVIEKWYKPNEHFIYFEGNYELKDKITEILNNWDKYQDIINNAFHLSTKKYTCKQLVDFIRKDNKVNL